VPILEIGGYARPLYTNRVPCLSCARNAVGATVITTMPALATAEPPARERPARRSLLRNVAPLVLCYHAVSSRWEHELAVPLDRLQIQLERFLAAGFAPVTASEAVCGSGRLLHVTFDDAFRSVLRALPLLEQLGVPATVFVSTAYTERASMLDISELRSEVERNGEELATLPWDEVRDLARRGVEIGSHTVSHPRLTALTDAELDRELTESKRRIEEEVGRPCRFLAYPYGDNDGRVRRAAKAAGYEGAFVLPASTSWSDPFQLGRVGIWRRDRPIDVALKTSTLARTPLGSTILGAMIRARRHRTVRPLDLGSSV
jgi:peptidoglycan/xylan/chitin deacetylase (PgdA/CDA1 family)